MKPNRYFHLRHSQGFSPEHFELFRQNCITWQLLIFEELRNWPINPMKVQHPVPHYEFGSPELSEDGCIATLPLGGKPTYAGLKSLEDYFPDSLWQWFPLEFSRNLELGYTYPGFINEPNWRSLSDEEINGIRRPETIFGDEQIFADALKEIEGLTEEQLLLTPFPVSPCPLWYIGHVAYQECIYIGVILQGLQGIIPSQFEIFREENVATNEIRQAIDSVKSVLMWACKVRERSYEYINSLRDNDFHIIPSTSEENLSVKHWLSIAVTHTWIHFWRMRDIIMMIKAKPELNP